MYSKTARNYAQICYIKWSPLFTIHCGPFYTKVITICHFSLVSIGARSPPAADNHNHKLFMWSGEIVVNVVVVVDVVVVVAAVIIVVY